MSHDRHFRLPVSTRHAFALAFDLAVRRDFVHSLIVPLLLHAPWILTLALLPPAGQSNRPGLVILVTNVALIGDFAVQLLVGAMLRFRARSVFNTPRDVHPAPVTECYGRGLARLPWLLATEIVRNTALAFAASFSILPAAFMKLRPEDLLKELPHNLVLFVAALGLLLPAMYLGFRLSFATEAVVLTDPHTAGAFQRSFHLTQGRFERWLEMILFSVLLGLLAIFVAVSACVLAGSREFVMIVAVTQLMIAAITPVIQYAWTFFYLRLVEIEWQAPGIEVGPAYASDAAAPERAPTPRPAAGSAPAQLYRMESPPALEPRSDEPNG